MMHILINWDHPQEVKLLPWFSLSLFFFNKCIYFWLRWVFVADCGLSLVVASRGYSSLQCTGFSLQWFLLLQSTGFRHAGFSSCGTQAQSLWHAGSVIMACGLQSADSVVVVQRLSCSTACEIFPDQGSNPCPLHWQKDS